MVCDNPIDKRLNCYSREFRRPCIREQQLLTNKSHKLDAWKVDPDQYLAIILHKTRVVLTNRRSNEVHDCQVKLGYDGGCGTLVLKIG